MTAACGPEASATTPPSSSPASAELAPRDPGPAAAWNYAVSVDEGFETMRVRTCWEGPAPARFIPGRSDAAPLRGVWAVEPDGQRGAPMEWSPEGIDTLGLASEACLDYEVDLAQGTPRGFMSGGRIEDAYLMTHSAWMWRPKRRLVRSRVDVTFDLPTDYEVSVSWPRDDGGVYHPTSNVFSMRGYLLMGKPERRSFEVAGARFEVAVAPAPHRASDAGIDAWVRSAGEAVATLFGSFPVDSLQVLVIPVYAGGGDPVRFGMTARGGGPGVILLLDAGAEDEALIGEWVAVHEMLHLGMPYVRSEDAWLSEGYATYYQQVVRARAGIFPTRRRPGESPSETQQRAALETLFDGFRRAHARAAGPELEEASERMHRMGGYQRVYWGGAALFMTLDIELRRLSGGAYGLDELMRSVRDCCATDGGFWSASDLLDEMRKRAARWPAGADGEVVDARPVLDRVVGDALSARRQPAAGDTMSGVGVVEKAGEIVISNESKESAAIRARIFSTP